MQKIYLVILFIVSGVNGYAQNVGIGTSTPSEKLTVVTPTNRWGLLHTDGTIAMGTFANQFFGGYMGTKSNHPFSLMANSLPAMTVFANGNVGIGTFVPEARFHIANPNGPTNMVIGRSYSSDGNTAMALGTSELSDGYSYIQSVRSGGTSYGDLALNMLGGNVGIGTTIPGHRLTVHGDTFLKGELIIEGKLTKYGMGPASLLPVCFGKVGAQGNIISGTTNFTVGHSLPGLYLININGYFFSETTYHLYTVIVTPEGPGGINVNAVVYIVSGVNPITVYTKNGSAPEDHGFHFIVYRSQ